MAGPRPWWSRPSASASGDDKPAAAESKPAAFQSQPKVAQRASQTSHAAAPAGTNLQAAGRSGVVLRTLTAEEKEARDRALVGCAPA